MDIFEEFDKQEDKIKKLEEENLSLKKTIEGLTDSVHEWSSAYINLMREKYEENNNK